MNTWIIQCSFLLVHVFGCSFMRRWPEGWTQTRKGRMCATPPTVLRWVCDYLLGKRWFSGFWKVNFFKGDLAVFVESCQHLVWCVNRMWINGGPKKTCQVSNHVNPSLFLKDTTFRYLKVVSLRNKEHWTWHHSSLICMSSFSALLESPCWC